MPPTGSLYLSIVLRSGEVPSGLLALLLGARLGRALSDRYGVPLRVKWPNDLLTSRPGEPARKLSGILLDRVEGPPAGATVVAGIGVNVAPSRDRFPPDVRSLVAALDQFVAPPPSLDDVEELVVAAALAAARSARDPAQSARGLAECRAALFGIGRRAWVDGVPRGRIRGLADDGALLLEDGPDLVSIRAGDLRVEETA